MLIVAIFLTVFATLALILVIVFSRICDAEPDDIIAAIIVGSLAYVCVFYLGVMHARGMVAS